MEVDEPFNGIWVVDKVPQEFMEILSILGYNMIEKKYLKKCKIDVHVEVDDEVLTAKVDTPFSKRVKEYFLTNEPVQYQDEKKNEIMEVAHRPEPHIIKVRTIYLDKGFTVMETREIKDDVCYHTVSLAGPDHPELEVTMCYERKNKKEKKEGAEKESEEN